MPLIAEELVQEWLNRQGFFTIRGIKLGVDEVDLLALRPGQAGAECRHIEVQVSNRPVGYISALSKAQRQASGRGASSAGRRTKVELEESVLEWVEKKYRAPKKEMIRKQLYDSHWTFEFVVNVVRDEHELELIAAQGVVIRRMPVILADLQRDDHGLFQGAAGAALMELLSVAERFRVE